MFERYTEKARRVIFFARYEGSNLGSLYIETEHLLLGLLREDKTLVNTYLKSHAAVDTIRRIIEEQSPVREKISTSVDLPLSQECKQVLALAAEEAERLGHKHIGTSHLLAGLLRQEKSLSAEILRERGVQLSAIRAALELEKPETTPKESWFGRKALLESRPASAAEVPAEMQAKIQQQAHDRGVKPRDFLRSVLEKALNPPPFQVSDRVTGDSLRETYVALRSRMEAEGLPFLDEVELEQEIGRRKGARPQP